MVSLVCTITYGKISISLYSDKDKMHNKKLTKYFSVIVNGLEINEAYILLLGKYSLLIFTA
jgi:hypothetical protein